MCQFKDLSPFPDMTVMLGLINRQVSPEVWDNWKFPDDEKAWMTNKEYEEESTVYRQWLRIMSIIVGGLAGPDYGMAQYWIHWGGGEALVFAPVVSASHTSPRTYSTHNAFAGKHTGASTRELPGGVEVVTLRDVAPELIAEILGSRLMKEFERVDDIKDTLIETLKAI